MAAGGSILQTPSIIRSPAPFLLPPSSSSPSSSLPSQPLGAHFFNHGRYVWLTRGGLLYVLKAATGECVSQLRLATRGSRVNVSCSCELVSGASDNPPKGRRRGSLLVLALESEEKGRRGSIVAVFSPAASQLLRAIEVPWKVSSLCPVSASSIQSPGLFTQSALQYFSGVVAIGCVGGRVLLTDLALDSEDVPRALLREPSQLVVVDSVSSSGIVGKVKQAREEGNLLGLDITAPYHKDGQFLYRTRDDPDIRKIPSDSLAVTALHFVPQILSLLIGYSFGGFQIFSTSKMSVVYGRPCPKVVAPVTHFAYQEPENDPKHNTYIWVASGNPLSASLSVETKVTLYLVGYGRKVTSAAVPGGVYQNFLNCVPRFEYALTPTPSRPNPRNSVTSNLLHCSTIELNRAERGLDESHDEAVHGPDLTVVVFIWRCGDSAHQNYMVGVFDLNQWYHSQMPNIVRWRMSGKHTGILGCSYFAFYSLNPLAEDQTLLDAAVLNCSLFHSLPPVPETHLWPIALSIDICATTEDSTLSCQCLGLQQKALEELSVGGPAVFSQPQALFAQCERADLLGHTWDMDHSNMELQQRALLSLALEHQLVSVLIACGQTWMSGGSRPCWPVMVEWIGQKLQEILNEKDHLCHPLFSGSAHSLDRPSSPLLHQLRLMLCHLSHLLETLLSPLTSPDPQQTQGDALVTELSGYYVTASVSHLIMQVVIWCVNNGLLPVSSSKSSRHFFYPSLALSRLCDRLRTDYSPCKLAVDHLCEDLQVEEEFHYPAESFEDFLALYTTNNSLAQHCLMVYFIWDVTSLDEFSYLDGDKLVKSYAAQFCLPYPLTCLVKGLWALDHRHYQNALSNLIGKQLHQTQWFPWQHSLVVSLLLTAPDPKLCIRYTAAYKEFLSAPEDLKLRLNALVRNSSVSDAVDLLRPYEDSEEIDELFTHFLDCCYQYKCLNKLVNIPLNEFEEEFLCGYLEDSPCLMAQELLIMFYLTHHRYAEAVALQEKIRPLAKADPDPSVRERSSFRDALLAGYKHCIPHILQDLASQTSLSALPKQKPTSSAINPPLSSVLARDVGMKAKSGVEEIFLAVQQVANARNAPAEPLTPFRQRHGDWSRDVSHTPFFSPPLSVKKAMSSRRKCPVVRATPISRPSAPSHVSTPDQSGMTSGLSFLSTHMQNFRQRMFHLSQTAGTIDASLIRTPPSKPTGSVLSNVVAPPSILKVRHSSSQSSVSMATGEEQGMETGDGDVGEGRGGGEGAGESEQGTSTPALQTRKIRFAVEDTPLVSPDSSTSTVSAKSSLSRAPTPYVSLHSSSPTSSLAVATPLPSSDDSDLFVSFTDSPQISPPPPKPPSSQTTPSQPTPSQIQPTPKPPDPKTKLFVGAEEDEEEEEEEGEREEEEEEGEKHLSNMEMETVAQEGVQSAPSQQSHDQYVAMETEKESKLGGAGGSTSSQKIRFQDPQSRLTRESISAVTVHRVSPKPTPSMEHRQGATPTSLGTGGGLFAPSRPSPLSYSISTRSPLVSSTTTSSSSSPSSHTSGMKKNIFSPAVASEIIEAKKKKLQSSLETMRKKRVEEIRSPPKGTALEGREESARGRKTTSQSPTVRVVKTHLSATMVQLPTAAVREADTTDVQEHDPSPPPPPPPSTAYQFSPGTVISTPPVGELGAPPEPVYVFSPPLTRSAARRRREEGGERQGGGREHGGRGDGGGGGEGATVSVRGTGRAKTRTPSVSSSQSESDDQPVAMVTTRRALRSNTRASSVASSHSDSDDQHPPTTRPARKSTRSGRGHLSPEVVDLVSPPSRGATPTTATGRGDRRLKQRSIQPHTGMGTRRSTRLLQDRKF